MTADARIKELLDAVTLDDKWEVDQGRITLNGTQALARVLLAQKKIDLKAGLKTGGYITGYRGSPLGNVDITLWSVAERMKAADIKFAPGVNEDIAATAVRGTQQLDAVPGPLVDGVFAAWYGKGPGVDRSGDALKHGNYAGAHKNGGVLIFYGDDHGGKSSSVAHHSEQAMAAALIPSLYPANVSEIIEFGLMGYAMSRYSGSWVGLKLVNEVVEQTGTVEMNLAGFAPILPLPKRLPPEGVYCRAAAYGPLREEEIVSDYRLPLVQQFVRANRLDRTVLLSTTPQLGLVTAGKSYSDTRQALKLLGLDDARARAVGISLYKVGCIWPLEREGIRGFAEGQKTLFFIEEKKSFVELQAASALINVPDRPRLIGKLDEQGEALLPLATQLEPVRIALAIAQRLVNLGVSDAEISTRVEALAELIAPTGQSNAVSPRRSPYFCSGCPHSRSTMTPEGSMSMSGIGCHTMAAFVRPETTLLPTQMGGEGANWIGLTPFSSTPHIFQNMGDGTYYHSGLLAIRAAVASGVNITYKILFNDAVAMTGGQPVDGPISVALIAQQIRFEGVKTVIIVSDNPEVHRSNPAIPSEVRIVHRDHLDDVQREMREIPGCTALIYEQTCAAEKRRRRKRGLYPDPAKRLFIAEAVCEGCGDCSSQSTCVSLMPVKSDLGDKRKIDQSSCNKDFSCLNGFCPSFVTVLGAEPRKPEVTLLDDQLFADLPTPPRAAIDGQFSMLVAGIGGSGVITVGAMIGMAAHIEGLAISLFDMTGLAQKNGAVFSHVRIARDSAELNTQKLGRGEANVLLAFDLVAGVSDEAIATLARGRTVALVNTNVSPTVAFQFDRDAKIDTGLLLTRLERLAGEGMLLVDATALATALLGDTIAANMMMLGFALQNGLLPLGVEAMERAITLNAVAVRFNLLAFRLGRLYATDPVRVRALLPPADKPAARTLDETINRQAQRLTQYQNAAYGGRYCALVQRVRDAERRVAPHSESLTTAAAQNYAKLLAYKDEYEVARMLSSAELLAELDKTFTRGGRYIFNLAPPIFGGRKISGRQRKRAFDARLMRPIFALMAKGKAVRGSPLDPFGWSTERRMERQLIVDYETLVQDVLRNLSAANHTAGVRLLTLVDSVRGFGPVKEAAIAAYQCAVIDAKAMFTGALAAQTGQAATAP